MKFKFITMHYQLRSRTVVTDGIATKVTSHCYTSFKGLTASVSNQGVEEDFSLSYWNPNDKDSNTSTKSQGSFTMWFNGKTTEQMQAYRTIYGDECILMASVDDDGITKQQLISLSDFGAQHPDTELSTAEQFKAFIGA